jgi:hypothetical protein
VVAATAVVLLDPLAAAIVPPLEVASLAPVAAVGPLTPLTPLAPLSPLAPVAPVEPVVSVTPLTPVAPVVAAELNASSLAGPPPAGVAARPAPTTADTDEDGPTVAPVVALSWPAFAGKLTCGFGGPALNCRATGVAPPTTAAVTTTATTLAAVALPSSPAPPSAPLAVVAVAAPPLVPSAAAPPPAVPPPPPMPSSEASFANGPTGASAARPL